MSQERRSGDRGEIKKIDTFEQPQFTTHPEWFYTFLTNTDQKTVQASVLIDGLQSRHPDVWRRISDPDYKLNILLLGAGTGQSEILFLDHLKKIRGLEKVTAHYQDPSIEMGKYFQQAANIAQVTDAVSTYETRRFEDPTYKPPDTDITLAFQIWNYIDSWLGVEPKNNSLVKLASSTLNKQGVAVMSLQSEKSENYGIRKKYIPTIHNIEETKAEDIATELTKLGISHDFTFQNSHLDVGSFFRYADFNPTSEGKDLLSFILRKPWDSLSDELKQKVSQDMKRIITPKGKTSLELTDAYIWIPRSTFSVVPEKK